MQQKMNWKLVLAIQPLVRHKYWGRALHARLTLCVQKFRSQKCLWLLHNPNTTKQKSKGTVFELLHKEDTATWMCWEVPRQCISASSRFACQYLVLIFLLVLWNIHIASQLESFFFELKKHNCSWCCKLRAKLKPSQKWRLQHPVSNTNCLVDINLIHMQREKVRKADVAMFLWFLLCRWNKELSNSIANVFATRIWLITWELKMSWNFLCETISECENWNYSTNGRSLQYVCWLSARRRLTIHQSTGRIDKLADDLLYRRAIVR